ncbi:hypothetical protein FZEAL_375 [Fusarium zealandicum]|uniref:C3H1-type domain-containing protein n=1 Tax=Fusarium zealandicum TaxID=1053134 RepID=A0A8H4UUV6_9HYPO|nr:hypothetical protein FZEAL_375 [Fusarium zealandicum]
MSQYGFGHGPPYSYPTSQSYVYPASQAYTAPAFPPTETLTTQAAAYRNGTTDAYGYNHTAIPGLGMGFSHNTAGWQQNSPHGPPAVHLERNDQCSMKQTAEPAGNTERPHGKQPAAGTEDEAMEEGELSEGELEDIYEPGEVGAGNCDARGPHTSRLIAMTGYHHDNAEPRAASSITVNNVAANKQPWDTEHSGRDRSGSYSPYLSPREIQSNGLENGTSHAQTPRSEVNRPAAETAGSRHVSEPNDVHTEQTRTSQADTFVSDSKRRAHEAILRLWPLNVRYQNYVEEGIDKMLLNELFTELGLESVAAVTAAEETPVMTPSQAPEILNRIRDSHNHATESGDDIEKPESTDKTKDKSEERKDRIARLLAAKGSKPAPMTADDEASKATPVPQIPSMHTKPEKTKAQSEKSRLIQQKMEALMKAREANAKTTLPGQDPSMSRAPSATPASNNIPEVTPAVTMEVDGQTASVPENADEDSAPPIPGLFLSPAVSSPVANQRKRPVAADLNEYSAAAVQKRPFGQTRESRPFLIDVSDDEDDAEMEIDSPELRPSSIQRPVTPGSRTTSFRDHPALPESASRRAIASPKTTGTPTNSANGMYDLESMNKKIEDMKRRIAEAEARKKAKQPSNGAPFVPQSQAQSKEGSVDTPTASTPAMPAALETRVEVEDSRSSTPLSPHPAPHALEKLPKVRGQNKAARPSLRARAASDRLPILEAQRRERSEHLRQLQSQVARIEQEIKDSLVEEERLREDALQPDSEPTSRQGESELDADEGKLPNIIHQPGGPTGLEFVPELPPFRELISRSAESPPDHPALGDSAGGSPAKSIAAPLSDAVDQDASMDESSSSESVEAASSSEFREDGVGQEIAQEIADDHSRGPINHGPPFLDNATHPNALENATEPRADAVMDDGATSSNVEDTPEQTSDDYEPTEAGIKLPDRQSPIRPQTLPSQTYLAGNEVLETSDADMQGVSAALPVARPISMVDGEMGSNADREVEETGETPAMNGTGTSFPNYESPLQYFRAYRFHPQYKDVVSGGLRSLTYSNKIDVKREVCPGQLTEGSCPRGSECPFQHFENMQAPGTCHCGSPLEETTSEGALASGGMLTCREATDDQILLQLGAYGNYEEEQQQQYVTGLRQLLTEFRNRKVKDFQAISEGIIEYRAKFHGDKTKILPLGGVSI